ncbi:MAG: hypothetical protein ACOH1J_02820, partial [Microbacteriaceae bacterium]
RESPNRGSSSEPRHDSGGVVRTITSQWSVKQWSVNHWWVKVIAIFAVSRVVTTGILLMFASRQDTNAWTSATPGYFDFARIWDGHWYYIIAVSGYPSELPLTDEGRVGESAWAFMPVYPVFVRIVMTLTGASFPYAAVAVSVAFALASALMFYKLMQLHLPEGTAMFAVLLWCFAPLSPIMQVSYAESMHAFFLIVALYLLVRRQYWELVPVIAIMALTRPSGLAFALAMGLHVVYRWVVRARDGFSRSEVVASVAVGLFSVVMGFAWLLIVAAATGSLTAYTDTELAWRAPYIGYGPLVPFQPWLQGATYWLGEGTGVILLAILVVGCAAFMFTPAVRRLGVDLRLWVASYGLYLLAVFFPQSSTFRLLFPVFPLWGAVAQPRSVVYRIAVVLACIAGQYGWVYIAWWVNGSDWTPP